MKFELLEAFALLFALALSTPVPQSNGFHGSFPVCSTSQGARMEDCREALTKISMTWPRKCTTVVITSFDAATVGSCLIRTWDPASAHCLEGENIVRAANRIMSQCWKSTERVVGKTSYPWFNDKTGVEIVWVQSTTP